MIRLTEIDNISIKIQSSSSDAAGGIRDLASALGELKKNGSIGTAVKNLKSLSDTLKNFTTVASNANKISSLAASLEKLKNVGSFGALANSLNKLPAALKGLQNINIGSAESKLEGLTNAMGSLSNVNAKGFTSAVNGLAKIADVTKTLDDDVIKAFDDKVKKLAASLKPLSDRLTTVKEGLKGFSSQAKSAGNSAKKMGDDIDAAGINFDTFTNNLHTAVEAMKRLMDGFVEVTAQAIEWDGISARFGRGFGDRADEVYAYVQKLNDAMGINVQAFMQHSSIFANMLTGFGVASEDASKMAIGYMELTYDVWAGYNDIYKTFEDAAEAIRSAIAGEVEPIRRAGFTIVEATLEVTAANHGITKSIESMTEAEKSYLRYLTLVDQAQAQNLIGTYAKELNTAEGLMALCSCQSLFA